MVVVKNLSDKLVIKLKTNMTGNLRLRYKRNGTTQTDIQVAISSGMAVWEIPFKNLNLNDTLTDFFIYRSGTFGLATMNEGLTWFVDGVEETTINNSSNWTTKFMDNESHTIQAVYRGNDTLSMSATPPKLFYVNQSSDPTLPASEEYKLEFLDKAQDTFTYKDNQEVLIRLTKGGVPVIGETVEVTLPTGMMVTSYTTRDDGTIAPINDVWNVGTYTLRAYYYLENNMKAMVEKSITVNKGDIIVDVPSGRFNKGEKMCLHFKQPDDTPLTNTQISIYINGKLYANKTNGDGNIWISFAHFGWYHFNVVYNGNSNLNESSTTFSKQITQ